jgi:preprotein translocase subunit SecD
MKSPGLVFNLFLLVAVCLAVGCKTPEERKKKKELEATSLQFHLETNPDGTPYNSTVSVYRADPILVNVEKEPVLDEGFMEKVELVDVDQFGGWGIKITFDPQGKLRLENLTTSYKGRRVGILARWTEPRWLGAPLIQRRITDGVFVFTPDASREEAQRLVDGLNNVIKKLKKSYVF